MMLMQPRGLWSAAHALHNPSFLGSTAWCYQLQSFTCVVHCCLYYLLSLIFNCVVEVGSYRAPAATSHLAVAISVSCREPSSTALPLVVLKRSSRVS
jgi:hypothetical protein